MDETKNKYEVLEALSIEGTEHAVGATVELTETDAAGLVEEGKLKLAEEPGE